MKGSLAILREANDFLDAIGEGKEYKPANAARIDLFRVEMLDLGFNAPFSALLKMTAEEMEEMESSDFDDLKKQMRQIKYIANLKKATLRRVRVALAAHKIAESALKRGREDLVKFLPIDGNHISIMAKTGEAGLHAYSMLMKSIVEGERGYRAVVEVEVEVGGEKITRQVRLLEGEKIDERMKREFGESAVLKEVRIVRASSAIIKNKSSRVAILCGEVARGTDVAKKKLEEEEKSEPSIREYNAILSAEKLERDVRIDIVSGFEKLKQKMVEKKLARMEKGEFLLDEKLGAEIRRRRMLREQITLDEAAKHLLSDMIKFYVLNGKAEREMNAPYPTLASEPTSEQLTLFNLLDDLIEVKGIAKILAKKFGAEKMGLRMKSAPFGAAVFAIESKKDAAWCSEFFGVPEADISEAIGKVRASIGSAKKEVGAGKEAKEGEAAGELGAGRGTDFLNKLKKRGK